MVTTTTPNSVEAERSLLGSILIDSSVLNDFELDPTHNLTDTRMINTWLFFNPVTAQPKMIDVEMAYNYTNFPAYDDTDPSAAFVVGDKVAIKFYLTSRKKHDRWYTTASILEMQKD
jgi:hypothetical protein